MSGPEKNEKRRHSRVDFETEIRIVVNARGRVYEYEASSRDLSMKGVLITTDEVFEPGTPCDIDIYLTGSVEQIVLNIQGTVIRKDHKGVAISFDAMEVETYTHLRNIITYNMDDEDDTM